MSEQPAASINCGYDSEGLPIGLQIVGRRFDDVGVLRMARAFEAMRAGEARPWPEPPGGVTLRAADRGATAPIFSLRREGLAASLRPRPRSGAGSARAEDCGKSGEGFNEWLNSFKQVAKLNGVSARRSTRRSAAFPTRPRSKRHDHGVAAFGHNFAGFAASHVTPGMVARGKAELKRYAEPARPIEQRFGVPGPVLVAIWGQETSFGGDNGSFPTYSALATLA